VTATPTTTGAALSWTAPTDTGGATITNYLITPYVGTTAGTPVSVGSAATTHTLTGLIPGTTYTFTVQTVTGNGTGPASAPSGPVTVGTALAPSGLVVTPGAGQVALKWAAPPANGVKVTGYAVTPYIGGVAQTPVTFNSKAKAETVTGLTDGTAYSFTVAAVSSGGAGVASAASPVYLIGAPLAPKAPKAKVKSHVLTVTWTAPVSTASPVTGYIVTPYVGGVAQTPVPFTSTATSEVILGLTSGTSYSFTVAAVNAFGTGPASPLSKAPVLFS
jgi:predicted RNA-binding protein with TRAM domain